MNDLYWIFDLIIPLMMIILGYLFYKHPPKTINYILGYRTRRAMLSQENWIFANKRMGQLWFKWGWVLLILVFLTRLLLPIESEVLVQINMYIGLAFMISPIVIVEKELRKK
ncbi:SdpI family protein [Tissierella praeacuta]|uniref:SdpI family protein n=1 Tax=Tissierella praeacuta TaxID=43131 RepID=UPI001C117DD7|nr:SdpI family protein [Tissierella praeacuta]MBU5255206.1 SdpI family protein [Tissierella praeacuta]